MHLDAIGGHRQEDGMGLRQIVAVCFRTRQRERCLLI
jgi:hypothetical protein